jgi:hypothetical protein
VCSKASLTSNSTGELSRFTKMINSPSSRWNSFDSTEACHTVWGGSSPRHAILYSTYDLSGNPWLNDRKYSSDRGTKVANPAPNSLVMMHGCRSGPHATTFPPLALALRFCPSSACHPITNERSYRLGGSMARASSRFSSLFFAHTGLARRLQRRRTYIQRRNSNAATG